MDVAVNGIYAINAGEFKAKEIPVASGKSFELSTSGNATLLASLVNNGVLSVTGILNTPGSSLNTGSSASVAAISV